MNPHDFALGLAGGIGSTVAIVHGVLTQRLMVKPIAAGRDVPRTTRRLVAMLLHFSTFNWFVGGLALIAATVMFDREAKLAVGLLVGSSYLFGAVGNAIATRGRHPGWALYGLALGLIVYGLLPG